MKNIYSRKQTGHIHIKIAILITAISISNIIAFVFTINIIDHITFFAICITTFIIYTVIIYDSSSTTWLFSQSLLSSLGFFFPYFFFKKKLLILLDSAALRLRDFIQYFELHNFFSKLSIWTKFVFYILFYQIH